MFEPANTVAEFALPPLGLVTSSAAAVPEGAPKVHETLSDVDEPKVERPHVPSAVAVTVTPEAKPVPASVKVVVVFANALAGVTDVMVGAG
jgi:hypothetical protein